MITLQHDFIETELLLRQDYEGDAVACLVEPKLNQGNRAAVLYLHGFVDYFFHPHLAQQFLDHQFDFYALDLRKYGRALRAGQHPNYCKDIYEYFEEISIAIERIKLRGASSVILLGHSTGGLIASHYLQWGEHRDDINALILNSPFFRFNLPPLLRAVLPLVAKLLGWLHPYANTPGVLPPVYAQSLHKDYYGEWDFNLDWKPIDGFPAYYRWLSAISRAHKQLRQKVHLSQPVLVMHSHASSLLKEYGPLAQNTDIVLNVEDIKRIGAGLGEQVRLLEINAAVHDIFLSAPAVRQQAFEKMFSWLEECKTE